MEFLAMLYTVLLVAICLMMALLLFRSGRPTGGLDEADCEELKDWLEEQLAAQAREFNARQDAIAQQNYAAIRSVSETLQTAVQSMSTTLGQGQDSQQRILEQRLRSLEQANTQQMEQLRRGLDAMQGEVCGTLKAGVSVNFSYYRLPEVLTEYHKKYPRVRLDIATGHSRHLYQQMLDGTLDIAVLRGEYPWDGTQFLLSQEDICLIYAREYEGKPLSDYLYIDHQTDASLGAQMARWRYENGVTGDTGSFVVDNITACLEMVKRGLGWALMPEIALDNFDGCVRPCMFENGEPFLRRTYIFCQRDAAALPQVQLFMDMLKKKR